jgi:Xaa-Pro aminopeptidase
MSELQAAAAISAALLEAGNDAVGFVIVGSGPNSASPHHEPTERKLTRGDVVVCDFGGIVGGYRSDITRTLVIGEAPQGFSTAYGVVRTAQERGVEASLPGTPASQIDAVAREVIEEAGLGAYFIHRTGHGIGLDAHEHPYIAGGSSDVVEGSMCFSIEPGVYMEGKWGIRIEDIVVAEHPRARRLNEAPREVIYL